MLQAFEDFKNSKDGKPILVFVALLFLLGAWKFAIESLIDGD